MRNATLDQTTSHLQILPLVTFAALVGLAACGPAKASPLASNSAIANVQNYGADPSGSGDSTQAFIKALGTGETVYVPSGTYKITSHGSVTLNAAGQKMYGDGRKVSILDYEGSCSPTAPTDIGVVTLNADNQSVASLEVTSHLPQKCFIAGIRMLSTHGLVDDVAVSQMWSAGVMIRGSYNTVLNSDLEYNRVGVGLRGDHHMVRGCYVSNHYSASNEPRPWKESSNYWDGILAEALSYAVFADNTIEDNGQSGIYTGGNHSVSFSNIIANNTVRHNRNEGIDQGVNGMPDRATNYMGHLVIVGNTSVDNFRHDIWMDETDGAVVAWNTFEQTPDRARWFAHDIQTSNDHSISCELGVMNPAAQAQNVIFVDNTCSQADSSTPALVFNPGSGSGNILGNNSVQGQRQVAPAINRSSNVIMPERK